MFIQKIKILAPIRLNTSSGSPRSCDADPGQAMLKLVATTTSDWLAIDLSPALKTDSARHFAVVHYRQKIAAFKRFLRNFQTVDKLFSFAQDSRLLALLQNRLWRKIPGFREWPTAGDNGLGPYDLPASDLQPGLWIVTLNRLLYRSPVRPTLAVGHTLVRIIRQLDQCFAVIHGDKFAGDCQ